MFPDQSPILCNMGRRRLVAKYCVFLILVTFWASACDFNQGINRESSSSDGSIVLGVSSGDVYPPRYTKGFDDPEHGGNINGMLGIIDEDRNKLFIYHDFPGPGDLPSVVLGQYDFASDDKNIGQGSVNASGFNSADSFGSCGTKILVGDESNNRLLVWNTIPTTNGQAADLVLGQPNFTSSTANNGGISASTMNDVETGSCTTDGKLAAADDDNHRILLWNTFPSQRLDR